MASVFLDAVSVDIPIYNAGSRSLKSGLLSAATGGRILGRGQRTVTVRAVDRMTLRVEHGDRVGLVGHNGAGKSTVLRLIAGIFEPTEGRVSVDGHVSSMFDIGFGMDEDATGWENISLRGRILGHSRTQIAMLEREIAQASGLGEFLDLPIRTYSAGMLTRLAFAISTSLVPDILVIDEGIGAGDAAFLARAKTRIENFIGAVGILVLASHAGDLLRQWCRTGVWMEQGRVRMYGEIDEVLAAYQAEVRAPLTLT